MEQRNADYARIEKELLLKGTHESETLSERFEYSFFMGDLNYRVNMERDQVLKQISSGKYRNMLVNDELNYCRHNGLAFDGFDEAKINFKPTFKFDVIKKDALSLVPTEFAESQYDTSAKQRIPSWTDRILFKSSKIQIFGFIQVRKPIKAEEYQACMDINCSDHKPGIVS